MPFTHNLIEAEMREKNKVKIESSTPSEGKDVDMKIEKPVTKPILSVICERIHYYRNQMGTEQKPLADLVGVTANSVSNWKNGRSRPDVNLLPGICFTLKASFMVFLPE